MTQKTISWDAPMLRRFKAAHKAAVASKKTEFIFDGNVFDVGYAKYLIEYLESLMKAKN